MESTGDARYIDFGLGTDYATFAEECRNNKYGYGLYYWNFPVETGLVNREDYDYLRKQMIKARAKGGADAVAAVVEKYLITMNEKPEGESTSWLQNMYYLVLHESGPPNFIDNRIHELRTFLMETFLKMNYGDFVRTCFEKTDVYSLGLVVMKLWFYTGHLLGEGGDDASYKIYELAEKMMCFDMTRRISAGDAAAELDRILAGIGARSASRSRSRSRSRGKRSASLGSTGGLLSTSSLRSLGGTEAMHVDTNADPTQNKRVPLRMRM
jgi:hypothetical protein